MSLSNRQPSAGSFDYFASWQTGGVVSVSVPPPYTLYVAVQTSAVSSSNYTVAVTTYDSDAILTSPLPLTDAEPLSSAIAAGECRYYTYNISSNSTAATIALTETYGQSWLLLNSPNTTALPTVSAAQYTSSSASFPLVALPQPAAGMWTVGVWCNASSAFSIIATTDADTGPAQLGVTYPGCSAGPGVYVYYSSTSTRRCCSLSPAASST